MFWKKAKKTNYLIDLVPAEKPYAANVRNFNADKHVSAFGARRLDKYCGDILDPLVDAWVKTDTAQSEKDKLAELEACATISRIAAHEKTLLKGTKANLQDFLDELTGSTKQNKLDEEEDA